MVQDTQCVPSALPRWLECKGACSSPLTPTVYCAALPISLYDPDVVRVKELLCELQVSLEDSCSSEELITISSLSLLLAVCVLIHTTAAH